MVSSRVIGGGYLPADPSLTGPLNSKESSVLDTAPSFNCNGDIMDDNVDLSSDGSNSSLYGEDLDPCSFTLSQEASTNKSDIVNSDELNVESSEVTVDTNNTLKLVNPGGMDQVPDDNIYLIDDVIPEDTSVNRSIDLDTEPRRTSHTNYNDASIECVADKSNIPSYPVETFVDVEMEGAHVEDDNLEYTFSHKDSDKYKVIDANTDVHVDRSMDVYRNLVNDENRKSITDDTVSGRVYDYITKMVAESETNIPKLTPKSDVIQVESATREEVNMYSDGGTGPLNSNFTNHIAPNDAELPAEKDDIILNVSELSDQSEYTEETTIADDTDDWSTSRGMISHQAMNLVYDILKCIKVVVGSQLHGNVIYQNVSVPSSYHEVYSETKALMIQLITKLKNLNCLYKKLNEECLELTKNNAILEKNRLAYCSLSKCNRRLNEYISGYNDYVRVKGELLTVKNQYYQRLRQQSINLVNRHQTFKNIIPKIESVGTMLSQLDSIYSGAGIKVVPIADPNVYMKTTFLLSFNNTSGISHTDTSKNSRSLSINILDDLITPFKSTANALDMEINMVVYIKDLNPATTADVTLDSVMSIVDANFEKTDELSSGLRSLINPHLGLATPNNKPGGLAIKDNVFNNRSCLQTSINWNSKIDKFKLIEDLNVVLYSLKPSYTEGLSVWYKCKYHLIQVYNKSIKKIIEPYLLTDQTLQRLLGDMVQLGCNVAAKIRKLLRELHKLLSITANHSINVDGMVNLRVMVTPSDLSQPCLWANFEFDFHKSVNSTSLLNYCHKMYFELVNTNDNINLVELNQSLKTPKECTITSHLIDTLLKNNYRI